MLKLLLLLNLLLFAGDKSPRLHLRDDLVKDRLILNSEHSDYNREAIASLKRFDAYANLSLTGFKFEKRVIGKHTILKWTKTTNPSFCVYEVLSVIPADTIYEEKVLDWDSVTKKNMVKPGKPIKLKPVNFIFHTYIIKPATDAQLIYISESRDGLQEYCIGKKTFYPVYESIPLGIRFPDLQEILRLATASQ
jgi:hypothetical protein